MKFKSFARPFAGLLLTCLALGCSAANALQPLMVYGPGGPAPAMKEAATAFEHATGQPVTIVAGPTPQWIASARNDADVIFSGSETMMTDFAAAMEGRIDEHQVMPMYLRPLSVLVRPGNPRKIGGLLDLARPGIKVLVVNGAGQNGVWEDAIGRMGDIKSVRALRGNIVSYAKNSALAKQAWIADPTIDAWVIWGIWQVANPKLADTVPVEPEYVVYRDSGVVSTTLGSTRPVTRKFIDFLLSPEGRAIFVKWGWTAG